MRRRLLSAIMVIAMLFATVPESTLVVAAAGENELLEESSVTIGSEVAEETTNSADEGELVVSTGDIIIEDKSPVWVTAEAVMAGENTFFEYEVQDGKATITKYTGNESALSIPDTLDGYEVVAIGENVFKSNSLLREVVVSDSVTKIGESAFSNCYNLSSVKLSKGIKEIDSNAFYDCDALISIEIPKSLTGGDNVVFYGDYGPFNNCSSLKNIGFEEGTTEICGNLFSGCDGLEEVIIPNTVTKIQNSAFKDSSLTKITMPESVTSINGFSFSGCSNLVKVIIPDSVTTIGDFAFSECSDLTSVKLSKGIKEIDSNAFYDCDALISIEIPKSLTGGDDVIFYGGYGPFNKCSSLKNIEFEKGTTEICGNLFSGCDGLEEVIIPDTVTKIQNSAFKDSGLTKITIPESVTSINGLSFSGCSNLEEIVMTDNVTDIGDDAFNGCSALRKVEIPNSVSVFGNSVFQNCTKLESAVLSDQITSIGNSTFKNCSSLKTIEIPDNVTTIQEYAFQNCDALETVMIGKSSSLKEIQDQAFKGCKALQSITLPNSVTSLGTYVFAECDALTDVTLGTGLTTIPSYAFNLCASLQKIALPYRVTTINSNAFTNCTKLMEVSIPRATATIATTVFSYPDKLTIYGITGTYAETYAGEIGATFVNREIAVTAMEFNKTEIKMLKGANDSLILTITPADFTDAITWRSSDTSIATVTADGTVKAVAVGTATISALAGDTGEVRASCTVEVLQPVTSIILNKTTLSMEGGETFELVATVSPTTAYDKSVEWTSSDESVAIVSKDGMVTALQKGTANITAKALGGNVSRTCKVTVNSTAHVAGSIEDMQSQHPYANNTNEAWIFTQDGADQLSVSFSDDTAVDDGFDFIYIYDAIGKEVGKYTGKELAGRSISVEGNLVKVKLVSDDAITGYGFRVTAIVAGGGQVQTVQAPTASVPAGTVVAGTEIKLTTSTEGADIYYTMDGSQPDTESSVYQTPIVINQDTTIKAFAARTGFNNSKVVTFSYTVSSGSDKLAVTFDSAGGSAVESAVVDQGAKVKEPATPVRENYGFDGWYWNDVKYNFDDPVTENMTLTAHWKEKEKEAGGEGGGTDVSKVAVTAVALNKSVLSLKAKQAEQLTVTISPVNATDKTVDWSSSDDKIARVDTNGKVTAVAKGTANITVTTKDGGFKAICVVTVTEDESGSGSTDPKPDPAAANTLVVKQKLDITGRFNTTTPYKKYSVAPKGTATVSSKGILTAKKAASVVTITGLVKDGKEWKEAESVTIKIENPVIVQKTITMTKPGAALDGNDNITQTTVSPTSWMSSKPAVVEANAKTGAITTKSKGTAKITAVYGEGKDAAKYTFSVKVNIPVMSKTKATMLTGAALQLKLKNVPKDKTSQIKWASSDSKAAEVDSTGKVTVLAYNEAAGGKVTITATIDGVPYSCEIEVKKPEIKKNALVIKQGKSGKVTLKNTKLKGVKWTSSNEKIATVDEKGKVTGVAPGTATIQTAAGGVTSTCEVTVQ